PLAAAIVPGDSTSGPPTMDAPSEIVWGDAPPVVRLPDVKAVKVQPARLPRLSWIWIVPMVVENDEAAPSVPLMETDGGTDSDSVPATSVTLRVESAHTPPPGAVHAYAGGAATSGVATATAATAAPRSLASDMNLSGRERPPCVLIGCATAGLQF